MISQLDLSLEPPRVAPPIRSWRQEQGDRDVLAGYTRFHPRVCKLAILSVLNHDTWTDDDAIFDATDMRPCVVLRFAEQLVQQGRLLKTELYFMSVGGLPLEDRTIKPSPKDYRGFSYGFKLTRKPPVVPYPR